MRSPIFCRVTVAASMFLAALSAAGCDRTQSGTTDVLVIGDPPAVVDPASGPLTEPQAVLLSGVAQGLVQFDAAGQIVPGLAERWNVTDDGLSYIFRLQSAEWPDSTKVTAQQVATRLAEFLRANRPALRIFDAARPLAWR